MKVVGGGVLVRRMEANNSYGSMTFVVIGKVLSRQMLVKP
jgi:hypothetical protein